MKYLLVLLLCSSANAMVDPKLTQHIRLRCNWTNHEIPLDIRMACMEAYINCAVVDDGVVDLVRADAACLKRKNKIREDAQE